MMRVAAGQAAPGQPVAEAAGAEGAGQGFLRLSGIHKQFADGTPNGTAALAGIDLAVARGEFISLLGPSGCGKSTLLRLIAGLDSPGAGEITWRSPPDSGDIGFVFQEPTLLPWATAERNVALPLQLAGVGRVARRERALAALAAMGLEGFAGHYPHTLSGGMKMRVAIARALVTAPPVLLLDEPFAALDEMTRHELNDDLQQLAAARGLTVIFVTHSVAEAVYLSQRIAVMSARPGQIRTLIPVDSPRPRVSEFRHQPAFSALCAEVSSALRMA